jgi:membrane protease YdiL (CAAX protease family)
MIPWRPLLIFLGISVGTTTAIAILSASMGWSVRSPAWAALAPIAMWAPAVGRFAARRTVDRGFAAPLPLRRWGDTGAQVILWPLAVPLAVYGSAYAIAWSAGLAHWSPGGGKWTTRPQIAVNLLVNLSILGVLGTLTALGEEIGWRGYLQPRLDAAGVRASVAVVWLCQLAYHAPLMAGAGYADAGGLVPSLALFAAGDLSVAFLWARESYRARSLWPAVFFHSFHNTISQWLFPKFFAGGGNELWLGESGLVPVAGYVVLGAALHLWMRRHGPSWQALARHALITSPSES